MSDLYAVVKPTPGSVNRSEPALLAKDLENARCRLFGILLENKRAAAQVSRQLLFELSKGSDCSEILLVKNSDDLKRLLYRFVVDCQSQHAVLDRCPSEPGPATDDNPVQRKSYVQLLNKVDIETIDVSPEACRFLNELHFLPAYLIETSECIQNQLGLSGVLDADYRARLQAGIRDLKGLRQQMIAGNTGLVAFVAHKYKTNSLSFEDLMQEGIVGLIKAVDRFAPERGTCFSTYAIFWIKQAISRLIVKQDKIVSLPVALAEKSSPVFEAMRNSYMRLERWPTLAELKACCDLTEQEIKTLSSYYQSTYVYDAGNDAEDGGMSLMESMQQQQFMQPLEQLIETDLASYMDRVVATLPEKQAHILAMRFGLKNHTEMTLQGVADHLQVTRERVRQIQNEALNKLKQQFGFDLMLFLEPTDV